MALQESPCNTPSRHYSIIPLFHCGPKLDHSNNPSGSIFSDQVELRGHIIDSLLLPKVLDEILTGGGSFTIREIKIGKQRNDPSYACIDVLGSSPEIVDDLVFKGLVEETLLAPAADNFGFVFPGHLRMLAAALYNDGICIL